MTEEVFIPKVLESVVLSMRVAKPGVSPVQYFKVNYEPGRNTQIIDSLREMNGTNLDKYKYPLIAAVMPISEKSGSGFQEVTFPRIVIAYLTKSGTNSEDVIKKYDSDGIFTTILRPCLREFIKRLAWSTYTSMGDPDAYEYISRESPSQQPIGEGLNDYVDIIEILDLKATIFPQIKSCK